MLDWTNLIFNNNKILEPVNTKHRSGKDKWKILCSCGKIFEAMPSNLKSNGTKSCGCKKSQLIIDSKRKFNYYNYINKFGVQLIIPVNNLKNTSTDEWYAICPNDGNKFITSAASVVKNNVKSCGCLLTKKRIENIQNYNKQNRINHGLNENEYLTNNMILVRNMTFDKIKHLVLRIDNYTCNLCLIQGGKLEVHHIQPWLNNSNNYNILYNIDNLITLCRECHIKLAHDGQSRKLNQNIKKELKTIISMRPISKNLKKEYDSIIENIIKPNILNYLKENINDRF